MRDQIVDKEIDQFNKVVQPLYSKKKLPVPGITLIVVNKRINQRMFIEDNRGVASNPQPGSIIDSELVEN